MNHFEFRFPMLIFLWVSFFVFCKPVWAEKKFIDLTHPFDQSTIYWPTSRSFQLEELHRGKTDRGYWYEANNFSSAEHGGTHIEAPSHFAEGKWRVDEIPLHRLIAPGILLDVSGKANPDYLISEKDFLDWEMVNGRIPEGVIVLVRTGWENFWPDKKKYPGSDKPGDTAHLHFPGFGEDAARFLSQKRKVAAVGLDTANLDFGQSKNFDSQQVFGEANVFGFENLHRLSRFPVKGFRVIALPMNIGGGSGAPLRIVAEIE
ncbi:MAG: cyclase family protein [Nitrospinae bacterium]|nr:cyclase family protein [Nitrospinota bacterium]